MWNPDYKLSYILSSSIQIFIFSGDYVPMGIGNEILSLLPLIFCLKLSPALQGKRKKKQCHLSFHWLLFVKSQRILSELALGENCKSRLAFTLSTLSFVSYFLRVFLSSPHIPESSSCAVPTR